MDKKNVEDIYPLTPMQQLMLQHSLSAPQADLLVSQIRYEISGELKVAALRQAWQQLVNRHSGLRTGMLWQGLKQPLQVVRRTAEMPWLEYDFQRHAPAERQVMLEEFLASDRQRGFDLSRAPLIRVALLRTGPDGYEMVWTSHHLLLDRWCISIAIGEVLEIYSALCQERAPRLKPPGRFRDYLQWLQSQDEDRALAFWQTALGAAEQGAALTVSKGKSRTSPPCQVGTKLPADVSQHLRAFARNQRITANTVFRGGWALHLHRHTGRRNVIFGATVSGRPAGLPNVEATLGSFVNNLPVPVRIDASQPADRWWSELQQFEFEARPNEFVSPVDLQRLAAAAPNAPLFDSLLVVQAHESTRHEADGTIFEATKGTVRTAYPLTLIITDHQDHFSVDCNYDPSHFSPSSASRHLNEFAQLIATIVDDPPTSLAALLVDAPDHGTESGGESCSEPANGRRAVQLPRDALESRLREIWQETLGVQPISTSDNFFELGGDSVRALLLMDRIEREFRRQLPTAALFQAASIELLAQLLAENGAARRWTSLTAIQPTGGRPPMFWGHSIAGGAIGNQRWAKQMRDQPSYAIQSVGLSGDEEPLTDICQMARRYAEEIVSLQASGPYLLGGYCFGGIIVFEVARQLALAGGAVGLLLLLDTPSPLGIKPAAANTAVRSAKFVGNLPRWACDFVRMGGRQRKAHLRQYRNRLAKLSKKLLPKRSGEGNHATANQVEEVLYTVPNQRYWPVTEANLQALKDYSPQPYPGKITLLKSRTRPLFDHPQHDLGWSSLALGGVDVRTVPGSHVTMLEPPLLQRMVAELDRCVDQALQVKPAAT